MTKTASKIRFRAKLFRPAATAKVGSWTFLILPKDASAKLPSRGMTTVEGTINGFTFRATLEPDGQKSHWLKVDRKLHEAAGGRAQRLHPLDRLRQAVRDSRASGRQCLRHADCREATRLLLRSVRVL